MKFNNGQQKKRNIKMKDLSIEIFCFRINDKSMAIDGNIEIPQIRKMNFIFANVLRTRHEILLFAKSRELDIFSYYLVSYQFN